jgi:hypothetical protein
MMRLATCRLQEGVSNKKVIGRKAVSEKSKVASHRPWRGFSILGWFVSILLLTWRGGTYAAETLETPASSESAGLEMHKDGIAHGEKEALPV